ncbi:putative galacturonosyltransferase 12 [Platanthera guangdongensis]|uniref:Hexosyltransferase n=1 Tax=Platanthera guangdongensis TaxID=2320717 RepID=A0ABR2MZA9_9ASPA
MQRRRQIRHVSKRLKNYLNFSHPLISGSFNPEECAWAYGMNIFDLDAWRKTNIKETYHEWIHKNLESDLSLWQLGTLPPGLIAFHGHVHTIDPYWHMLGLGYQENKTREDAEKAARTRLIHRNPKTTALQDPNNPVIGHPLSPGRVVNVSAAPASRSRPLAEEDTAAPQLAETNALECPAHRPGRGKTIHLLFGKSTEGQLDPSCQSAVESPPPAIGCLDETPSQFTARVTQTNFVERGVASGRVRKSLSRCFVPKSPEFPFLNLEQRFTCGEKVAARNPAGRTKLIANTRPGYAGLGWTKSWFLGGEWEVQEDWNLRKPGPEKQWKCMDPIVGS